MGSEAQQGKGGDRPNCTTGHRVYWQQYGYESNKGVVGRRVFGCVGNRPEFVVIRVAS